MSDLNQFSVRMSSIAKDVLLRTERVVRAAALAADAAVVTATPVDTGRARSNWLVEIDLPANGTREPYAPGSKLGLGDSANLSAAIEHAAERISGFNIENNSEIHITNNLHYIGDLNNGTSRQAPENFVQIGVSAAAEKVRQSRLVQGN